MQTSYSQPGRKICQVNKKLQGGKNTFRFAFLIKPGLLILVIISFNDKTCRGHARVVQWRKVSLFSPKFHNTVTPSSTSMKNQPCFKSVLDDFASSVWRQLFSLNFSSVVTCAVYNQNTRLNNYFFVIHDLCFFEL